MSGSAKPPVDALLKAKSRAVHGHMYVLPVAAWILESNIAVTGVSEAMAGLDGPVDRPRVIEALAKLVEIGALEEMPRGQQRNSPRMFQRVESPYWAFAAAESLAAEGDRPFEGVEAQ